MSEAASSTFHGASGWGRWFWPAAAAAFAGDQATKWWLQAQVQPDGFLPAHWPGWLAWHHNPGVAWSMLSGTPGLVLLLTLVLVPVLAWTWWRHFRAAGAWANLGFGLVMGGAAGNLVDRLLAAFDVVPGVRDFIHVDLGVWPADPWPTFNVADAALCAGFAAIIISSWRPQPAAAPKDA